MSFPVESRYIGAAETRLQMVFPPAYRSWLLRSNGGVVEIAGEPWFLHPVLDDSDPTRFRRTWDDVVRQTEIARRRPDFPAMGLSIAGNGCGDRLVLLPGDGCVAPSLWRWDHETGAVEPLAGAVEAAFRSS